MRIFVFRVLALLFFSVIAQPVCSETWTKAESDHFTVYSQAGAADSRANATRLETLHQLLASQFRMNDDPTRDFSKLDIYFLENAKDLKEVRPDIDEDVRGFVTSCQEGVQAFVLNHQEWRPDLPLLAQGESATQISAFHAYTALYLRDISSKNYPRWFIDGAAEYFSTVRLNGNTAIIGAPWSIRLTALNKPDKGLSFEAIVEGEDLSNTDDRYYAQAWLLTHFILSSSENRERFDRYLSLMASGKSSGVAFEDAFAIKMDKLPERLATYLSLELESRTVALPSEAGSSVYLQSLPPSSNQIVLWRAALIGCSIDKEIPNLLEKIRLESSKYPADKLAILTEVRAAMRLSESLTEASLIIDKFLVTDPGNSEAQYLYGRVEHYLAVKSWNTPDGSLHRTRALNAFSSSHNQFPHYAPNLFFWSLAQYPDPKAADTNLMAYRLAPSVDRYAWTAIHRLIANHRLSDAESVLLAEAASGENFKNRIEAKELLREMKHARKGKIEP